RRGFSLRWPGPWLKLAGGAARGMRGKNMARVAVVTGGTRGIGRAICEALKAQGLTVAANYAGNDDKARAFTQQTDIPAYKWDVGDHEAALAGCRRVAEEVGAIDVLVNNAGITRDGTLLKMSF